MRELLGCAQDSLQLCGSGPAAPWRLPGDVVQPKGGLPPLLRPDQAGPKGLPLGDGLLGLKLIQLRFPARRQDGRNRWGCCRCCPRQYRQHLHQPQLPCGVPSSHKVVPLPRELIGAADGGVPVLAIHRLSAGRASVRLGGGLRCHKSRKPGLEDHRMLRRQRDGGAGARSLLLCRYPLAR